MCTRNRPFQFVHFWFCRNRCQHCQKHVASVVDIASTFYEFKKTRLNSRFHFRWLKISIIEIRIATSLPWMFNHLNWNSKNILKSFLFGAWVCTPFACFFMMMPAVILITPFVEIVLDTVMFHWCSTSAHFLDILFWITMLFYVLEFDCLDHVI